MSEEPPPPSARPAAGAATCAAALLRGQTLLAHGSPKQAAAYLERLLHRWPDCVEAYQLLGIARSRLGKAVDAMDAFSAATQLSFEARTTALRTAWQLVEQGKNDRALALLHALVERDQDHLPEERHLHRATLALLQGRPDLAEAHVCGVREWLPNCPSLRSAHLLVHLERGDPRAALRLFQELETQGAARAADFCHATLAALRCGERAEAQRLSQCALALAPHDRPMVAWLFCVAYRGRQGAMAAWLLFVLVGRMLGGCVRKPPPPATRFAGTRLPHRPVGTRHRGGRKTRNRG